MLNALSKLERPIEKYLWLQQTLNEPGDLRKNAEFQRRFTAFYRVRRNQEWRKYYFGLLEKERRHSDGFSHVLQKLRDKTGRIEASFASKLVATVDNNQPVIDSIVLKNVRLRLPAWNARNRFKTICGIHSSFVRCYRAFLKSEGGEFLVRSFREKYPEADVSAVKMLDFVLWQNR